MASKKVLIECFTFLQYCEYEAERRYASNPIEENLKLLEQARLNFKRFRRQHGIDI